MTKEKIAQALFCVVFLTRRKSQMFIREDARRFRSVEEKEAAITFKSQGALKCDTSS